MEEEQAPAAPQAAIAKIIAPGDVATFTCPVGSEPQLKVGDLLPSAEDAQFFVSSVDKATFSVGPMKAGSFELVYKCSDGVEVKTMIETPFQDPQKLPPMEGPIGLLAYSMYLLWIILGLLVLAGAATAFWHGRKRSKLQQEKRLQELSSKPQARDSQQLIKDMIAWVEAVEKNPAAPEFKSDEVYQKGYRSIRGFLERELKLKTQAETTTQFLGSLKIAAVQAKIPADLLGKIERSMVFSDQNRFGAALSDSVEARKNYATELKGILKSLATLGLEWRASAAAAANTKPARKPSAKPTGAKKA